MDITSKNSVKVFISYSRKDHAFAHRLRDDLIADGFDAYLDVHNIVKGEPWKQRLAALIAGADSVLFLLSPDSVASEICAWEVDEAERLAKRVFPVVCRPTDDEDVPGRLRRLNYTFLETDERWRSEYPGLIDALRTDAVWVREHTRIGELAARWEREGKTEAHLLRTDAITAADAWAARRPMNAPPLSELMLEFLDASLKKEREDRDTNRRLAQRGFVRPARTAISQGRYDAALRLVAAGAILSDDPQLSLEANAAGASRFALWRAASEAVQRAPKAILHGHQKILVAVAFGTDGSRILTCSYDGTARLWDTTTGAEVAVLCGHEKPVQAALFSPDGTRVLTASEDGTARLWDPLTGQEIMRMIGHQEPIWSAAFSPGGKCVLTGAGALNYGTDNTARLWDATTGNEIATIRAHGDRVTSVAFSPDGERFLTGSSDGTARLWNAKTTDEIAVLHGRGFSVNIVAFSLDGTKVLTGAQGSHNNAESSVRLWDAATGRELLSLQDHQGAIADAAISPDGTRLITASQSEGPQLWDAKTGEKISDLANEDNDESPASCVAFSPDSTHVATGDNYGVSRVWAATSGIEIAAFYGHEAPISDLAFSPNGKWLVTAGSAAVSSAQFSGEDPTARVWEVAPSAVSAVMSGHSQIIWSMALSPDGTRALTGSMDGSARLWEVATGAEIAILPGHENKIYGVSISPDGSRALTGAGEKNTARLWEVETGSCIAVLRGHEGLVTCVAFSPDGTRALTGAKDGTARLWDTTTGAEIKILYGHHGPVKSIAFSPNGALVLTGAEDHAARLWNTTTGATVAMLIGHAGSVECVAFSPDGTHALTGSEDGLAKIWDVATGILAATLNTFSGDVSCAVFSPDGKRILTGSREVIAQLWERSESNASDWREVALIRDHLNFLGGLVCGAFSPDGSLVVTGSYNSDILLVSDARTGARLALLEGNDGGVFHIVFSADGTRVLCSTKEGAARLWNMSRIGVFDGDRTVYLTAALDCGIGIRSPLERSDLLMQDAPDDLYATLMERLSPEQRARVPHVSRLLRTPLSPYFH